MQRALAWPVFFTLALLVSGITAAWASAPTQQHDIRVSLEASSGKLRVSDLVQVSGQTDYRFLLAPWLELDKVWLNGEPVDPRPAGGGYRVAFTEDGRQELEFELSGRLPSPDNASASASSHGDDGSYLPAWDAWIPHDPAQALAFRLRVEVPASHRAVATGRLLAESNDGAIYSAVFEQSRPGEAPSLFAGPFQVQETLRDGIRLRTYFHPGLEAFTGRYLDAAGTYIARYRADIGEYPYSDFHVVSAPLPVGLGYAGLTYIDRRIVPLPFMQSRSLAHEVLHSWWGNAIAVDYATGNWAEGLTTYLADYALERDKGAAEARAMRVRWLRDYAALPASRDQPIRDFRAKQHQAGQVIGYNKVAFVFHMLEREIGQASFADGIRRFWRNHRFTTASWDDLQHAFEQAARRDLDPFFRQWIDQPGAPRIHLGEHSVTAVEGGYRTRIEVVQPVTDYRLKIPVRLLTEAGSEDDDIEIGSTRTLLEWTTPGKPVSIRFDPDTDLFRRLDTEETPPILRDVTLNPATQTRIIGSAEFTDTARRLAARLLDTSPVFLQPNQEREAQSPLMLIVPSELLDAQLSLLGIDIPAALPGSTSSASAWVTRFPDDTPLLVISADKIEELAALLRPLPHYGGQSYVMFVAGRAVDRGVWKIERGSLYRDLGSS